MCDWVRVPGVPARAVAVSLPSSLTAVPTTSLLTHDLRNVTAAGGQSGLRPGASGGTTVRDTTTMNHDFTFVPRTDARGIDAELAIDSTTTARTVGTGTAERDGGGVAPLSEVAT